MNKGSSFFKNVNEKRHLNVPQDGFLKVLADAVLSREAQLRNILIGFQFVK